MHVNVCACTWVNMMTYTFNEYEKVTDKMLIRTTHKLLVNCVESHNCNRSISHLSQDHGLLHFHSRLLRNNLPSN